MTRSPRSFFLIAILLLPSCSNGAGPGTVEMIGGRRFDPQEVAVRVGDTVTWTNTTDETHTVTAYEDRIPGGAEYFSSGGFDSQEAATEELTPALIKAGEEFSVTFDVPGTYEYFCIPHLSDGMRGAVVVEG